MCQDPDLNWGHGDFQSPALPTELSRLQFIYSKLRCVVCETLFIKNFISSSNIPKNYNFALIANKAVPNEVVFLQETIGILIIFSLIFLDCGFFEPPPIVIIF